MLLDMAARPAFSSFFESLPIFAVDGSLAFVTDFQRDPTLTGATGKVSAKSGSFLQTTDSGLVMRTKAMGGYVRTKRGRQLAFALEVNDVPIASIDDFIKASQDLGTISAILWRDY